ncbi:hypothetical protein C1A40_02050 [Tamlana carrageenivorans]|uniref:Uncharacterized protein n=1 Tax=Pseudotamlana carrageenivorans TaxID=2069432 RepID=A0A2I7SEL6_9FLAO|nr:hypothetical protein C1A40_02050 [Tamlana carrageenivorans]
MKYTWVYAELCGVNVKQWFVFHIKCLVSLKTVQSPRKLNSFFFATNPTLSSTFNLSVSTQDKKSADTS